MFVSNFANQLLQHVFQGDDAVDGTALVHHNRHVLLRLEKRGQECGSWHRVRHQHYVDYGPLEGGLRVV